MNSKQPAVQAVPVQCRLLFPGQSVCIHLPLITKSEMISAGEQDFKSGNI